MEAIQSAALTTSNINYALKKTKRSFSMTAEEKAAFPTAITTPEKIVVPDISYSLLSIIPVTGPIGTTLEAGKVYDFANQLDTHAKAKDVGAVISVSVENGKFVVGLRLSTTGEQASHGAPAANAFTKLKDFLSTSTLLTQGAAGKSATWKAKVNGTTILEGRY